MRWRAHSVFGRPALLIMGVAALWLAPPLLAHALESGDLYSRSGLTPVSGRIEVPEFSIEALDGSLVTRRALLGRVVLANFWATWCEPCKAEMPVLERLRAALAGEPFDLFAITVDNRKGAITAFAHSLGLTFPILLDERKTISDALMVRGLPTTILIGKDGKVLARAVGPRVWDSPDMLALIRSLMER